jgi:hypothetical protein
MSPFAEGWRRMEAHIITTTQHERRVSKPPYWLVARDTSKHLDVFTVDYGGDERRLPVFTSKEEARLFAEKQFTKGGWHARPVGIGELVSVLYGPCRTVDRVALDPPWETLSERTLDLVSVSREVFVEFLVGRGRSWFEEGHRRRVS